MEFLVDPHLWIGLATLIILEVVLGIDNLVFIAILADKLPPNQRDKARIIGLSLALIMRIILLFSISWVITLTQPLFSIGSFDFSGRSIILMLGGIFLLAKGTMELHERLEGGHKPKEGKIVHAVFWQVIVQIVVLDAVFSLDSVITAVAIVDNIWVMIAAVCIAMAVMMTAAKPLMSFVSKHPTVIVLCLGFLLMIGFSLVVEGLGFHIPKGYLYVAIGFSVLVEAANQLGRHNREKNITKGDLRERTSEAVFRLLGGRVGEEPLSDTVDVIAEKTAQDELFRPEEKDMIRGVLALGDRPVSSIMSSSNELEWLDLNKKPEELYTAIRQLTHSRVILAHDSVDNFVGVAVVKELLNRVIDRDSVNWARVTRQPAIVHESTDVLKVMEHLRRSPVQMVMIVDEHGALEGIATPTDVLEAIAGEFPDMYEEAAVLERQDDGSWLADGFIDIRQLSSTIGFDLVDAANRYSTLAGYILTQIGHLPQKGDSIETDTLSFEILSLDKRSIAKVRIREINHDEPSEE